MKSYFPFILPPDPVLNKTPFFGGDKGQSIYKNNGFQLINCFIGVCPNQVPFYNLESTTLIML
jgi:hypothetical protein